MTYNLDSMSAVVTRLYGATPYAPESTRGPDDDWRARGLCRTHPNPDLWYPDKGGDAKPAKLVCNGDEKRGIPACPVRRECLRDALETDDMHGVFGGLSARERRPLHRAFRRSRNTDFQCDHCPESFGSSPALHGHKARRHRNEVAA